MKMIGIEVNKPCRRWGVEKSASDTEIFLLAKPDFELGCTSLPLVDESGWKLAYLKQDVWKEKVES